VFLPNYQSTSRAMYRYDPLLALGLPRVAWRCHVLHPICAPLGSRLAAAPPTSAFERLRIFPTFGVLAFPSYRQKKICCENDCVRAPSDRGHTTQGTLIRRPARLQFSCLRASNRRCKTWKNFKAIHVLAISAPPITALLAAGSCWAAAVPSQRGGVWTCAP
jgi:hypothetical protein